MDPRKNPEYLRSTAEAVEQFRSAFIEFLDLHVFNTQVARGILPAISPKEDADPAEIERLGSKVGRAAGLASNSAPLTNMYIRVQGVGTVDPIAAWHTVTQPKPVLEPPNILAACDQAIGRLEAMAVEAEAERPPAVGVEGLHPSVWGAAKRLWRDGHYREAVAAAGEAVAAMAKARTGRYDIPETSLWQQVFSKDAAKPGMPRLRWPGDPAQRDVSTMSEGLRSFSAGVQMTIRNPAAHRAVDLDTQAALERLSALSLLAHWVDTCEIEEAAEEAEAAGTTAP
jgi:uncharacterized protein (TIGR02391 family)